MNPRYTTNNETRRKSRASLVDARNQPIVEASLVDAQGD
jgi:hypothetical protein